MCGKLRRSCCFAMLIVCLVGVRAAADPGLVGWWKFEEAGGTLYDQSDYGNDGIGNGVTYRQPGQDGYALGFDGVDDLMPFGVNARPSDTFSFGGWFKTSSTHEIDGESIGGVGGTSGQRYAFDPAHGGDSNGGAGLSIGTNGISVYEHGSGYMPATAVYAVEIGAEWNHVMVVYDNRQPTIYLNGEAVHTGLASPRAAVQAPVQLGGMAYGYFEGLMDEVRIYNRALTQPEIAGLAIVRHATGSSPADGSNAPPDYHEVNVYMVLDYVPGLGSTTHTAYFSDNFDDVNDRRAEYSLGDVPPWPALSDHAFVVGYDDPGIPEYARAPLVGGRTYYWCIDEFDGSDTWPGRVWSFTVMPKQAWGPTPPDGADLVPPDGTMTWNLGDISVGGDTLSYNIYIGTDEAAVAAVTEGDTVSPMYAGSTDAESFEYAALEAETGQFWRVDTVLTMIRPPFIPTITKGDVWSFTSGPEGSGGLLVEYWENIPGGLVSDLTSDVNYPHNPDSNAIIPVFETPTGGNEHNNFGGRVRGWLYVKNAGDYEFWLATDDGGELWLSSDASAANARLIASVDGWVPPRDFDNDNNSGGPNMASGPISLSVGMHYVEALYKEGAGGDNLAVAWLGPDSDGIREIIPGGQLISYYPVVAENPDPAHLSVDAPTNVMLTWTGGSDRATKAPYPVQRVYVGDSAAAVAAANTSSPEYMGEVSTDQYGPIALDYLEQVYWRVDGVSSDTGTVVYPGSVWTFRATYDPGGVCDPNLKLWLAFEDDVLDSSGYGRDGTTYGEPSYVPGADGQAISFDGIDDYVNIEVPTGISGDAPRTIAGWAKASTTAISDWSTVFGFCPPYEGNSQYFDIEKIGGGNQYGVHVHGLQWGLIDVDLEWHHFAVTYEPGSAAAYVDGELLLAIDTTGYALSTADVVRIGHRPSQNAYFPGSVDDVRIYDVAKDAPNIAIIHRIDRRLAWAPEPYNGATDVPRDKVLSWAHGDGATMSMVYFGKDDPGNMVEVAGPQAATTYDPAPLALGATYYWKIVENSAKARVDCHPTGEPLVWKFTTAEYLTVDDMESYTPWTTPGDNIFEAWRDGLGNCAPGNGNNTGANLVENSVPVFGGVQSMKYDFDNDGLVYNPCTMGQSSRPYFYSKIEAQAADLASGIGSDWTIAGVKALQINFAGEIGNSTTEPFWVQLQDSSKTYGTKVFYGDNEGEELADFNDPAWHQWDIDLADFNVDLTNVVSIVIGIGDEGATSQGGFGTLYIDDIRLYVPRCLPHRAKPAADFDDSCQVDYADVAALFDSWLLPYIPETAWGGAWQTADIGDVDQPGSYVDLGGGVFNMTAGGADIWGTADAFLYVHQPLSGDGQLTVRVTDIAGPSTNNWRKAGVMIRETLDADSAHAFMAITPVGGGGKAFQWRPTAGVGSNSFHDIPPVVEAPMCVRILRTGDTFRGFYYLGGEWVQQGDPVTIAMAQDVHIGMAVTSHDYNNSTTVRFDRACSNDFVATDLIDDNIVNFRDYAELLSRWLEIKKWP